MVGHIAASSARRMRAVGRKCVLLSLLLSLLLLYVSMCRSVYTYILARDSVNSPGRSFTLFISVFV